jgi:hypothetical protein
LLDRIGAAGAIVADMACSAGFVLIVAMLAATGTDSAGSLLCLVALGSLTNPLSWAGIRVLLPRLVPPAALERANALDIGVNAAVDVCGPALAGALFALATAPTVLLLIGALYGAACVALLPAARGQPRSAPPGRRGHPRDERRRNGDWHNGGWPNGVQRKGGLRNGVRRGGLLADAVAGVAYLLRHRSLRPLALSYALYNASWGVLLVAVPVFVIQAVGAGHQGDALVGAFWAASGVAGGVGALLAGRHGAPGRERAMMALGMLATALAIYPVSARFGLPGLAIGLALVGFLAGPIDVGVLTLRQRRTEPAWLGRVMAVSISLNLSGQPIGSALGGILLTRSVPATFAAAALTCAAAALASNLVPKR